MSRKAVRLSLAAIVIVGHRCGVVFAQDKRAAAGGDVHVQVEDGLRLRRRHGRRRPGAARRRVRRHAQGRQAFVAHQDPGELHPGDDQVGGRHLGPRGAGDAERRERPPDFRDLSRSIRKGDQFVRTETLTQDIIKVGKLSSSHLRIDDEAVSRMHAVIEIAGPGEIYIIDLGSTKGTLVNGQKVNKTKLQSGDQIVLGGTKLVVTVGEPVAAQSDDGPTQVQMPPQTQQPQVPAARADGDGHVARADGAADAPDGAAAGAELPAAAGVSRRRRRRSRRRRSSSRRRPRAAARRAGVRAAARRSAATCRRRRRLRRADAVAVRGAAAGGCAAIAAVAADAFTPPPGFDPSAVEVQDGSRAIEVNAMFEDAIVEVAPPLEPDGRASSRARPRVSSARAPSRSAISFITLHRRLRRRSARCARRGRRGTPPASRTTSSSCRARGRSSTSSSSLCAGVRHLRAVPRPVPPASTSAGRATSPSARTRTRCSTRRASTCRWARSRSCTRRAPTTSCSSRSRCRAT